MLTAPVSPASLLAAQSAGQPPKATADLAKARAAAEDFEAVFAEQMFNQMFVGLEAEEPFGGGQAETMWRSLQIGEHAKAFAAKGGFGLADAIMGELLKTQEVQ